MSPQISRKGSRKGKKLRIYSPRERAEIGKLACSIGTTAAARRISKKFEGINESTVRGFKKSYLNELRAKRLREEEDLTVEELPLKKRGRPLLLGKKLDEAVQQYIIKLREHGCPINTVIVLAIARGIVKSMERTRLAEYGGPTTLTTPWAKSLLKRMNFTKRRVSTKSTHPTDDLEEVKKTFLTEILETVEFNDIPPELIFNWDQTGINLVPTALWTMDKKGKKRIEIAGYQDKRQITAVMCGSLVGELLPFQLVYAGKTDRCHPAYKFPSDWQITHTENHWSNERTMLQYIREVIVPFVDRKREDLSLGDDYPALAVFDHFKGQLTDSITQELEANNIHSVLIPAAHTGQLQPMDISVNKVVKSFLRSKFSEWYSDELAELLDDDDDDTTVDLSTARMKSVGGKWIVQLYEYLENNPHMIVHGFRHAGFFSALGLLDNDDSTPDYSTTDDSDIDDEIEELMEPSDGAASKHLSVATVYSGTEEETERIEIDQELIIISSSEDDL